MIINPRFWRLALVSGCLLTSMSLWADGATPDARALDRQTELLKSQVLEIDQLGQSLERQLVTPDPTRLTVFFGINVSGLLADSVFVTIDNNQMRPVQLSERQAIALLKGGLVRVGVNNSDAGPHRIHVEFSGHYPDSKPKDPPVTGSLDQPFFKDTRPLELTLEVNTSGILNHPKLEMTGGTAPQ
jgi:hypothetical protein